MDTDTIRSTAYSYLGRILIWTIGFLILSGLTKNDLHPLVTDYLDTNKFGIEMEIMSTSKSVRTPGLALMLPVIPKSLAKFVRCMQMDKNEDCEIMNKLALDMGLNNISINASAGDPERQVAYQIVRKLVANDQGQDTIGSLHWNHSDCNCLIVEAAVVFFQRITLDYDVHIYSRPPEGHCEKEHCPIDILLFNKANLERLYNLVIDALCERLRVFDGKVLKDCSTTILETPTVIAGGWYITLPLSRSDSMLTLQFVNPKNQSMCCDLWQRIIDGNRSMMIYDEGEPMFRMQFSDGDHFRLFYKVQLTIDGNHRQGCYQENSPVACQFHCLIGRVIKIRRCMPFSHRHLPSMIKYQHLPYCNSSAYRSVNWSATGRKCNDKCRYPCEYVSYILYNTKLPDLRDDTVQLQLDFSPLQSPYVQFRITDHIRKEQMVASVGGVLGLYLGISGWTFVTIIIWCLKRWKKWKKQQIAVAQSVSAGSSNPNITADLMRSIERNEQRSDARFQELEQNMELVLGSLQRMRRDEHYYF